MRPVRDRYKIFIIDEVHQLSTSSFNALLKSIEEPPPHVVFMMATTELHKIPDTIRSRSQVFEFRTIGTRAIAEQLRTIADGRGARRRAGRARAASRARPKAACATPRARFDQVIAFAGEPHHGRTTSPPCSGSSGATCCSTSSRRSPTRMRARVFDLAGRVVEIGPGPAARLPRAVARRARHDGRAASTRRARSEPEFAPEGDVERLADARRAVLARGPAARLRRRSPAAEFEVRTAAQPRYHLEMALLKWIHLRKLTPIEDILAGALSRGSRSRGPPRDSAVSAPARPASPAPRPSRPRVAVRLTSGVPCGAASTCGCRQRRRRRRHRRHRRRHRHPRRRRRVPTRGRLIAAARRRPGLSGVALPRRVRGRSEALEARPPRHGRCAGARPRGHRPRHRLHAVAAAEVRAPAGRRGARVLEAIAVQLAGRPMAVEIVEGEAAAPAEAAESGPAAPARAR